MLIIDQSDKSPLCSLSPTTDDGNSADLCQNFQSLWKAKFSEELSWEFSARCLDFATEGQQLGQKLARKSPPRPQPHRPDRPSARRQCAHLTGISNPGSTELTPNRSSNYINIPRNELPGISFNPTALSTQAADDFFHQLFADKPCDTDALKRALTDNVPT